MWVERTIRFAQEPAVPVWVFFAQLRLPSGEPLLPLQVDVHQHLRSLPGILRLEPPSGLIDIPFLFDVHDLADASGAYDVADGEGIGLAAMLRPHLHDLLRLLDAIACLDGLGEYVGKGFLHITVFARLHYIHAQLGVLKVSGGDHHPVNIFACQHLFGVLIGLWFEIECLLDLGGPMISCVGPQITDRDRLDRDLFRRQRSHMDMTLATVAAAQLSQANAIVRAQHTRIRPRIHPYCQHRTGRLFHKRPAIDSLVAALVHTTTSYCSLWVETVTIHPSTRPRNPRPGKSLHRDVCAKA